MRVVLADDSVLFRSGLAQVLARAGFEVVGEAGTAGETVEMVRQTRPHLAIVDIRMPPSQTTEGLFAALRIRKECEGVAVLLLSHHIQTQHLMLLIQGGVKGIGYLLKDRVLDLDQFCARVRDVGAGGFAIDPEVFSELVQRRHTRDLLDCLSDRESEVLARMAEGRSNGAIAHALSISPKTVEGYVNTIYSKLALEPGPTDDRRVMAVLMFLRGEPTE